MSVREEEDENGRASREWTVIPLRRWRVICTETVQRLLLRWLAVVCDFRKEGRWKLAIVEHLAEGANILQIYGKAPYSQWFCFERAILSAS
jgi:hypothetical protein